MRMDGDGDDESPRRRGRPGRPVAVRDWPPGAGPNKQRPASVPATRNWSSCSVSGRGDVDVVVNGVDLKGRTPNSAGIEVNRCTLSRQDSVGADCVDSDPKKPSPRKSPRFKDEGSKVLVVEPLQARTPIKRITRRTPKKRKGSDGEANAASTSDAAEVSPATPSPATARKNAESKAERTPPAGAPDRAKSSSSSAGRENLEAAAAAVQHDREAVRRALRTYDALRRMFAREEKVPGSAKRPDLKAASLMRDKQQWINKGKCIGPVPGVEVGDHYWFRMELCLVGLHRQIQAGIDCISFGHGVSLATSICASGGYENAFEDGETLIYTGQGGINYKGDKKQREDQKLERGNLALSNSLEKKNVVRVIRGLKDKSSPSGTTYIYDGLYRVVKVWIEKSAAGYGVYKFKLQRQPGQAESGTEMLKFLSLQKEADSSAAPPPLLPPREGLVLDDLSGGKEQVAVCLVNQLDSGGIPPAFEYVTGVVYPDWFAGSSSVPKGCRCSDGGCCKGCACMGRNQPSELPYTQNGSLVEARGVIYECGSLCECSASSCYNRVSQQQLKLRLEVFKTKNRGWGVRSWDPIPCGSFVCEYMGEVINSREAERRENDEYLFDLDCIRGDVAEKNDAGLCLDASRCGNVARFINHSCCPNLFVQPVVYGHHGARAPHVVLFAMENVLPMKELTYDYGLSKGNGDVETTECHCGYSYCRGRLY